MPTISLCMIARNEAENIRRCLASAHRFVDEIILVDTGSTDLTKDICAEYGAHIFDYTWADNFSAARNFGLKQAAGDWILWLDADEELEVNDDAALQRYLQSCGDDLLYVPCVQFYGDAPANEKRAYLCSALRMFRSRVGLRFTGKVHEHLDTGTHTISLPAPSQHFLQILHYGYMDDAPRDKGERNIRLLLAEKNEHPDDAWLFYHLAVEYYRAGNIVQAFSLVNEAIAGFITAGILPPPLTYKLKYNILITTSNFQAAYPAIEKAIALYPDYVDLHFYKGISLFAQKQYSKAEKTFEKCLLLGEGNPRYLTLVGTGSFLALYYSGACRMQQQEYEKASEYFRKALAFYPEFEPAVRQLKAIAAKK